MYNVVKKEQHCVAIAFQNIGMFFNQTGRNKGVKKRLIRSIPKPFS